MQNKMPSFDNNKKTYTVDEIQEILGIGKNSAYDLIKSNVFKSIKVGRMFRVSKASCDKWLECDDEL